MSKAQRRYRPKTEPCCMTELKEQREHFKAVAAYYGEETDTQAKRTHSLLCRLQYLEESLKSGKLIWKEESV